MTIKNLLAIIITAYFVLSSNFFVYADEDFLTELSGGWWLLEYTDEMSDEKHIEAKYLTDDSNAVLFFGCAEDTTLLGIKLIDQYINRMGEYANIEYRIDKNKSNETKWRVLGKGFGISIFRKEAINLLRKFYQGEDVFLFKLWTYDYDSELVKIPLTDIKEPIELIAKQCNWSP